jgi:signal transduction histidine kinase
MDLAESLPPVWGNAQHLAHVVVNLIVNALESLPDSSHGVCVSTRGVLEDSYLVLEVADQGIGIEPEHLAHLCDPFFTTKAAKGGTGLGLAITANLVHDHGGRLTFASEPGKGTCASVTLPLADPLLSAATARSAEAR